MDKHELIAILKDMAIELGRTPYRSEFIKRVTNGQAKVELLFGSYTTLCMASGLDSNSKRKTKSGKLTNEIFVRDVEEVIDDYKPREEKPRIEYAPTLILGDVHSPFINKILLEKIYKFAQKNLPTRIIQVGDLYDMYCHSRFPKSQNIYTPKQEHDLGRRGAEEMWKTFREIAPKAECIQLKGNHCIMPLKRTLESLPALEHVVEKYINEFMTFEGVKLIEDPRQEYFFDDVQVVHGYKSRLGDHRDYALMNTICGHSHVGGVVYRRIQGKIIWELNAGLIGDPESKAFGYTPQKMTNWTPGFGWLDGYGPRFIAL